MKEVSGIFDAVGGVLTVPESQLDAVTALSGSGPAYFFLMVEALIDAGVAAGLSRAVATDLVAHTMAGSAAMLLDRLDRAASTGGAAGPSSGIAMDTTPAQLRATVTSPGEPPRLVCGNSNAVVCGRRSPKRSRPRKGALSSSELHRSNSFNYPHPSQ